MIATAIMAVEPIASVESSQESYHEESRDTSADRVLVVKMRINRQNKLETSS